MATTTTNNGWTIPQSTDLVTNGATAIATLGNNIDASMGTGLKAWTAFTPTATNFSFGTSPTLACYYVQVGKVVTATYKVVCGTSPSAPTGLMTMSLPVTARSTMTTNLFSGIGRLDTAANWLIYGRIESTTTVGMWLLNVGATFATPMATSATSPAAAGWLVANSNWAFTITYEAA